jgi:hypothetical protein
MRQPYVSNAFLSVGILVLFGFGMLEMTGFRSDPLLPAVAAFCLGCTAVLDRVAIHRPD